MTPETARKQGLEVVYPKGHELHEWIFWDPKEGKYYDSSTDLFLENDDPRIP